MSVTKNCLSTLGKVFFHPESPAGLLWDEYSGILKEFEITFSDPHRGQGGFGPLATIDAGPNVHLLMKQSEQEEIKRALAEYFQREQKPLRILES